MGNVFGIYFFSLCLFSFSITSCMAQREYGKYQIGVYSARGNSLGVSPVGATIKNQINPIQFGYVGVGFYSYIQLRDDSTFQTAGYLRFLRVDVGIASRSGIFEPTPGNLARLTSADIDLALLLPLSFKAASEVIAYATVGPALTVQYNRTIIPTQPFSQSSGIRMGLVIETGFRLKSGSFISYRTMIQSGSYNYRIGAITFGYSPQNLTKRKKR